MLGRILHTGSACLLSASICSLVQAQSDSAQSTREYHHQEVVVVGSRLFHRSASTLGAVTSVSRSTMERLQGKSIDAVLGDEAGLFVRDIGGPGGVKTVSIRGSAANQTVVLFNGIRLNSVQNGLADLGLLPVEVFDAVEVVRGGQSALFGPDASSGAVILTTSPNSGSGTGLSARVGSFEERGIMGHGTLSGEIGTLSLRVGTISSGGAFPFPWDGPEGTTTFVRHGASFSRSFGSAFASYRPGNSTRVESSMIGVLSDRGSPGPVTSGGWTDARLRDGLLLGSIRVFSVDSASLMWEGGLSVTYQDEEFEPENSPTSSTDRYTNRSISGWVHGRHSIIPGLVAGWGIESFGASLTGSAFESGTRRSGGSLLAHIEWGEATSKMRLLPAVRLDMFTDLTPQISPRLAAELVLDRDQRTRFRTSVGAGFRMPSFNELYWRPGGNRSLRHERTTSADAGIEYRGDMWGDVQLFGGVFVSETRDRISGWPPLNVDRSRARGVEWSWHWSPGSQRIWWTGTWAYVENLGSGFEGKQIPFMPRQVFAAGMDITLGPIVASPVIKYQSRRFTTVENFAALSIPPMTRVSVACSWKSRSAQLVYGVQVELENVLNAADVSLPGFPLPGRSLTLRTSLTYDPPERQ